MSTFLNIRKGPEKKVLRHILETEMGKKCLGPAKKMYFLKLDFGRGLYVEVSVYSCLHSHITFYFL
jgi:hypothetical protein